MNMRILHLYEPTPESPYLSARAAANHWLPPALRALDHEVVARPLAPADGASLAELSRHFDVVHVFGDAPVDAAFDAPVVQTRWNGKAAAYPEIALSWRQARAAHRPPVAVVPPGVPTREIEPSPERGDHFVTDWRSGEDATFADALSIAASAERELVILIPEGSVPPAVNSPLVRFAEARRDSPPAELLSAAAYLSLSRTPADIGAVTALAAGVPVLTLDSSAAAEAIVSGESGYVGGSIDELKFAAERLDLLQPHLARARARTLFDAESWALRLVEVYSSVAEGKELSFRHPEQLVAAR